MRFDDMSWIQKYFEFSVELCEKERTPIDRFDSADAMASNQFKGEISVAIRSKIKKNLLDIQGGVYSSQNEICH